MGRKTPTDLDQLMAELAGLHKGIHWDDPLPADETEVQAAVVQIALQRTITNLLSNGCDPKIVELAFFSNWRRLIALTAGFEDEAVDVPFDQSLAAAAKLMRSIARAINDEGPSPEMARVGGMVSTLKASCHDTACDTLSHAQLSAQSEAVNVTLVRVIGLLLGQDLRVSLVQDLLLYFWLRLSTVSMRHYSRRSSATGRIYSTGSTLPSSTSRMIPTGPFTDPTVRGKRLYMSKERPASGRQHERGAMNRPDVQEGQWIKIGANRIDGLVIDIFPTGDLGVGYYQSGKAIKEDVTWKGDHWDFRYFGPCGSYLRGHEAEIVKKGPSQLY